MNVEITIEEFVDLREVGPPMPPLEREPRCPVCGSPEGAEIAVVSGSVATRWCTACGHVYRSRRPTREWYRDWYASAWDSGERPATRLWAGVNAVRAARLARNELSGVPDVLHFCRPAVEEGSRVLDVGCGSGAVLRSFKRAGCRAYGTEPSPHRAQTARLLGATVVEIPGEDLSVETFGGTFDLVLSHHVLEHVVDPHEYVQRVADVLRPGGWLYVAVPNAANDFLLQHVFYALHVQLFSRRSLEMTLREAGFEPQRVAEDHQLRILARRTGAGSGDPLPAADPLQPDALLRRLLGVGYRDYAGERMYCKWSPLPRFKMLREPYAVEWSTEREPLRDREIGFRSDSGFELPVVFAKRDSGDGTPFWVK